MTPLPDISPAIEALKWLLSVGALVFAFWLGKVLTKLSTSIEHLADKLGELDRRILALEKLDG